MRFRKARSDEAELLTRLVMEAKSHWGYSAKQLEAWRTSLAVTAEQISAQPAFVLEADGVVGFYSLRVGNDTCELDNLWVVPSEIGHGHGRALLDHAVSVADKMGFAEILIDADPNAGSFYVRNGAIAISAVSAPIEGQPDRARPQFRLPTNREKSHAVTNRLFVIVSGLPASGKSTVAAGLAHDLRLPLLDKDVYLEALFEQTTVLDAQRREQLSRRADAMLKDAAQRSAGAVLSSWWRHPKSKADSGTPVSWLTSLPGILVELRCACPPEVATARFLARKRHPGHCDERHSELTLVSEFVEQAKLGPLGVGPLVEVDSELPADRAALAERVRRLTGNFA